jgi:hypothetical protein
MFMRINKPSLMYVRKKLEKVALQATRWPLSDTSGFRAMYIDTKNRKAKFQK